MAKEQKPIDRKKQQALSETIRKRLRNLFSSKDDLPASISIRQAEQLKARIAELEAKLEQPQAAIGRNVSVEVREAHLHSSSSQSIKKDEIALEGRRVAVASRVSLILLAGTLLCVGFSAALLFQTSAWQSGTMLGVLVGLIGCEIVGLVLIRRGRERLGVWLLLIAMQAAFIGAVALIEGIGLLVGVSILFLTSIIVRQTLPAKTAGQATILGAAIAVTAILLDLVLPAYRLPQPETIRIFQPGILGIIIFLFGLGEIRQFANYSLRTKLVLAFVVISIASVGSVAFFVDRSQRENRTNDIGNNLAVLANSQALQVGQTIASEFNLIHSLALTRAIQERAQIATRVDTLSQDEINQLDQQWRTADAADDNTDSLVAGVLQDSLSAELLKFQASYPEHAEIFLTDLKGVVIATTDRTSDYLQSDEEWWLTAYKDGQYIGEPEYDQSSKTLAINMAVPVRARWNNQIVGILRTTVNINLLSNVLVAGRFGETGLTEIYLPSGQDITLTVDEDGKYELTVVQAEFDPRALSDPSKKFQELSENGIPNLVSEAVVLVPPDSSLYKLITGLDWHVVVLQEKAEALHPVEVQTRNNLLLAVIVAILAAITAIGLAQALAGPLVRLNEVAENVASGDLTAIAKVESGDETGTLATTFNSMVSQLRGMVGTLEQRVADRTHDLELAAEVARAVSEKSVDIHGLLTKAVDLIGDRFNLYYTQIYLVDPTGRSLILRAGTGDVGKELLSRAHHLPIASGSINGRAAAEKRSVIVADTKQSADFLPNPLLPDTRCEMATPLIAGGQVVGVLDMQSDKPGTLNETNLPAFEALAGQLAIAIQNAALFAETERARSEVEAQVRRLTEQGWHEFLDAVEREEQIGFVFDQTNMVALKTGPLSNAHLGNGLKAPITITGARIGAIQIAGETDRRWTKKENEILQAIAAQLAQHVENLRLLAQAERYRAEAEEAVRRLTREGWMGYLQVSRNPAAGYVYDLDKVQPLPEKNTNGDSAAAVNQPLVIHNEIVGELALDNIDSKEEADEVVRAVARQLSGHIETLRLTELNEKRAYELATVATVSTTASTVLDPEQLLQSVVDLTKERFGLYHVHIYLADNDWKMLLLTAGAGEVGRKMVAQEHNIPMDADRSLVARAAREQQAAIVNDVRGDPGFLPNPFLPDTRSEMAVPMIVGDKVLGVFDVQSDKLNGFSKEDADIYVTLAAQVSVALQNARLYVEQSATVTQLRELDRLKSSFLANMSHELRTPLNSILGFADVILEELDGPLTTNMSNDLQLIQKNGQHLLHLINDVLDMAKIEAGKMNLSVEQFRIHETLEEAVSITSPLAGEKSLSLFIGEDSDRDVQVYADRTRIRQVMINLVNNAVKFTEQGSITLQAARQGEHVLISVRDTGVGISPDKLESVFQEFTQLDTSTTRKAGGTGLGLPISRRLIDMHGGRMWAESTGIPGEGSTFYVELPLEASITEAVEKRER